MNDFLNHIRQEKLDSQQRRYEYTKLKFLIVVGLLGVGNWKFSDGSENYLLLYLVPFVGFAIDLYVHGENFGIRRIGYFLKEVSEHIAMERAWELFVDRNRDQFTRLSINVVSGLVFIGTFFILQFKKENFFRDNHPTIHYSWIVINVFVLLVLIVFNYRGYRSLYKNPSPIPVKDTDQSSPEGQRVN